MNESYVSIISLIIAALAVVFSPIISYQIARKQLEISIKLSHKNIISPIRQNWINELREILVEISTRTEHYWVAGFEERGEKEYYRVEELKKKLLFYLNSNEEINISLIEKANVMIRMLSSGVFNSKTEQSFWETHNEFIRIGQKILKKEWERVKNEI